MTGIGFTNSTRDDALYFDRLQRRHQGSIDTVDEHALIQRLIDGDEDAFHVVVTEYQGAMLSVARAIVGPSVADEVVQDAWIAVLKALPNFEGRSRLKTWIVQIVANLAKTRRRREVRSVAVGHGAELEDIALQQRFQGDGHWSNPPGPWGAESPEQLLGSEQLRGLIEEAIEALPENQKAILTLADIEGVEMAEICNILDVSESNSRVLLHRARARIWQVIDKFQRGEAV